LTTFFLAVFLATGFLAVFFLGAFLTTFFLAAFLGAFFLTTFLAFFLATVFLTTFFLDAFLVAARVVLRLAVDFLVATVFLAVFFLIFSSFFSASFNAFSARRNVSVVVALVDFGLIGHFDKKLKQKTLDMFSDLLSGDANDLVDHIVGMGGNGHVDRGKVKEAVSNVLSELHKGDISKVKGVELFTKVLHATVENGVKVPKEFVLFAKSIVLSDGLALSYNPHFDFLKYAKPYIETLIKQKLKKAFKMDSGNMYYKELV